MYRHDFLFWYGSVLVVKQPLSISQPLWLQSVQSDGHIDCMFSNLLRLMRKKTSITHITGPFGGIPLKTSWFHSHMSSNAKSAIRLWRHPVRHKIFPGSFHVDSELLEFAELGCINEFDMFGLECSWYQINPALDMPSDGQRVRALKLLIDEGYGENIVIAHDVHTKHRLVW